MSRTATVMMCSVRERDTHTGDLSVSLVDTARPSFARASMALTPPHSLTEGEKYATLHNMYAWLSNNAHVRCVRGLRPRSSSSV